MKTRDLTLKQQAKQRTKALSILKSLGFQQTENKNGAYWWRKVASTDQRVCVGFDVVNQCSGGRTGWVWQQAPLDKEPLFGYSGTASIGSSWATADRIIDTTLEKFWGAGIAFTHKVANERIAKAKEIVNGALAAL
jgi:hypothetical protein